MSVNKVILLGRLGGDPELRHTQSGMAVCNLNVATTEKYTDKEGQKQENTEWHNVVVWGKQGENCQKYLAKGRMVYLEGRITTEKYTDKNDVVKYTTKVVASSVQFLSDGAKSEKPQKSEKIPEITEDDLPF